MSGVILDKERGVNAHVAACEMCGKDYGVLLLGTSDWVATCVHCKGKNLCTEHQLWCNRCRGLLVEKTRLAEMESVISGVCIDCEKEAKEQFDEVGRGGIFWKCDDCHSHGVLKAGSEYAEAVRAQTRILPPNPVGITFSRKNCPACTGVVGAPLKPGG